MSVNAAEILQRHAAAIEAPLRDLLRSKSRVPQRLSESMLYSLLAAGKRIRPALVLESCVACGGRADDASAVAAAVAIELVHTFSLVHDDLPAMDDDDLRRGKPTNHKVFGEAMAILAGDAMLALAFETLADKTDRSIAPWLIWNLASATGPNGMIGGQATDIENEGQQLAMPQLQFLHRMKTGALIHCACRMGAICARNEDRLKEMNAYGDHLGIAFQIVDDVLDVTSTPEQLGKKTNKDAGNGKNTYPQLIGLEASRAEAHQQVEAAIAALSTMGNPADGLRAMARFVIARQF
jgi:geranylgeranyl diphosphate synthase type II